LRIGDLGSTQDFSIWNLVSIWVVDFTNTQICGWNKAQRSGSFADNSVVPTLLTLNLESLVSAYAILVPYKLTHVCMYMWYMIHLTFKLNTHMNSTLISNLSGWCRFWDLIQTGVCHCLEDDKKRVQQNYILQLICIPRICNTCCYVQGNALRAGHYTLWIKGRTWCLGWECCVAKALCHIMIEADPVFVLMNWCHLVTKKRAMWMFLEK
jgi:hypothetical protein